MSHDWTSHSYIWRGKTYKTISGFCRAMSRAYPGGAVSFDTDRVNVRFKKAEGHHDTLSFRRTIGQGVSVIADNFMVVE